MIKSLLATLFITCLLATSALAQDAKPIPDLKGTWESTVQMHYKTQGHVKPEGKTGKMVVLSQEGRVFHGTVEWSHSKGAGKYTFSAVLDKDGVTFYLAGHEEGLRIGKMDGPDAFTLYILIPGGNNPRAGLAEFKRVK